MSTPEAVGTGFSCKAPRAPRTASQRSKISTSGTVFDLPETTSYGTSYSHSNANAACKFNVSQTYAGAYTTITEALNQTCVSGSYEITLLDSEHIEYLILSSNSTILIQGGRKIQTIWKLDQPHREIVDLKQGLGIQENSYISMIAITNFSSLTIKSSKFQNASLNSQNEAVSIYAHDPNQTILIQSCEFSNIITNNQNTQSALTIWGAQQVKVQITGNKFLNCKTALSNSGALSVYDFDDEYNTSTFSYNEFRIDSNAFQANVGNSSGAVYLMSSNPLSAFSFANNMFFYNRNNETHGIGQDAFLVFTTTPEDWRRSNITDIIRMMFVYSTSSAQMDSVYFEAVLEDYLFAGAISLPNFANEKQQKGGITLKVVVGSMVSVGIVILIILIAFVFIRKKKSNTISSLHEDQYLLERGSSESQ
ncbi:MAG: hypothetical protein EZS28_016515 [Streblomastix strix]|uniref:Right handed beta helix domain-containing protein n=1 Tax=Streblomastix strix TaxID=222440 RepID=A0A5J4VZG4_9EUKA|nr:MAG: hypothetical protein EZS28_016515 [Streblomastix strix]